MTETYTAPDVSADKLTPVFVRNELLSCFQSANTEFMKLLGQPFTDQGIKQQVQTFVETVFSECGVSYAEPTKAGIVAAISQCKSNAEQMMGPQGASIIQHHYDEMMKLVDRMPG